MFIMMLDCFVLFLLLVFPLGIIDVLFYYIVVTGEFSSTKTNEPNGTAF